MMKLKNDSGLELEFTTEDDRINEMIFKNLKEAFKEKYDDMPTVLIFPIKYQIEIYPIPFNDYQTKKVAFDTARILTLAFNCTWYAIITPMWFSSNATQLPSQADDKREGLLLVRVKKNKDIKSKFIEVIRDKESIEFKELEFLQPVGGNLTNFFDYELPDHIKQKVQDDYLKHFHTK